MSTTYSFYLKAIIYRPIFAKYFSQLNQLYMIAIVDCNSFYCSCERVFRPDLYDAPVVVLSNNDGCVVSRTDEAVQMGVTMAVPYYQVKQLVENNGMYVFSSNYNLYGDMSWRVMEILRTLAGKDNVEVYSVDEAFVNLGDVKDVHAICQSFRQTIEQWSGIKVSVGAAPTKVLAKVANRIAKKNKVETDCIKVLNTKEEIAVALQQTFVKDVWGIGRQYALKIVDWGIYTAYDLQLMNEDWARRHLGGVVGVRLLKELKGEPAIDMQEPLTNKKNIATTRMFGAPVSGLKEIKEAIATYTAIAAAKLRRQYSAACMISVFAVIKVPRNATADQYHHGTTVSDYSTLPYATSNTNELIKAAMMLAQKIYRPDVLYSKAGVMLGSLVPDKSIQSNLFEQADKSNQRMLMNAIDNINAAMRDEVVKFAAAGITKNWKMRQEMRSPRFTTRWEELCEVK
ncbi:Y-family DNA polymerase [Ilyomonas limi]|uniref:Y-family DNA polymerase n=1 Tax=Ilyomonas limi TaxID=2575867 RepID=A0A4U3L3X4_9BACT|nr:Y-family DNA polymerase [Ilyomonas limi]TKK69798.1 Y-family DNA polymerase [Ilyomonas limi]